MQQLTQTPSTGLRHPWRKVPESGVRSVRLTLTPSLTFQRLSPNSARIARTARIGYATEGPLFIPVQLSTDAVSAFRKVRVLMVPKKLLVKAQQQT